jgi:hypothetical protein
MTKTVALVIAFTFCTPSVAQETSVESLLRQSEPAIQKRLDEVHSALNKSSREDLSDSIQARQVVAELKNATADKHEIVKQVAIFAAGSEEQQPLVALAVLHLLDLPSSVVIDALSPYLNADNVKVRSFVRDWFQNHDNGGSDESPLKSVNFEDYADYLRRKLQRKESPPEGFVDYLFERSPGRALLIFNLTDRQGETVDRLKAMRRELDQRAGAGPPGLPPLPPPKEGLGRREILLAEHIISDALWLHANKFDEQFQAALPDAMAELEKLAKHKQWWARLYVAYIMRQNPVLLQDHILQKLAEDGNELVSEAAKPRRE